MFFCLILFYNFSTKYQEFLNSPQSESIFVNLVRKSIKIDSFKEDPVVLWFWRSKTNDTTVDSFFKKISLSRNFYLSGVLRWEAMEAKNTAEKFKKLMLAVHFDSLSIENFISLISLGLVTRNSDYIKTALFLPVFSDFRNQIFLIANFTILIISAILIMGIIFVIVKSVYYLPVFAHRLNPIKHNPFSEIVMIAILLAPIFVNLPYLWCSFDLGTYQPRKKLDEVNPHYSNCFIHLCANQ